MRERILDRGRLTLYTSWLHARPVALATTPEDTVMPLLLALVLAALFTGVLLKALVPVGLLVLLALIVTAAWLWPERERRPA